MHGNGSEPIVLDKNDHGHDLAPSPGGPFAPGSNGGTQHQAGRKLDAGKAPIHSLFMEYFPHAIAAVAMVSEYGARKYTPGGWKTVPDGIRRYTDADVRHLTKEVTEGAYDVTDSGLAHAAQHAWNALARLERQIVEGKVEIMRGNDIGPDSKPVLGTAVPMVL